MPSPSDWRLWQPYDPQTGIERWYMDPTGEGKYFVVKTVHYGESDILDENKRRFADNTGKRWGDGQVACSIPMHLFEKEFMQAASENDHAYIRKKLNDPDYKYLRTFGGTL